MGVSLVRVGVASLAAGMSLLTVGVSFTSSLLLTGGESG